MVGYLALMWSGDRPDGATAFRSALPAGDWRLALDEPGLMLALRGPVARRVRRLPGRRGLVIGDLFHRSCHCCVGDEVEGLSLVASDQMIAHHLSTEYWGRYVAILRAQAEVAVFRDPSGAIDAVSWATDGLILVGSDLPDWLPDGVWPKMSLDLDQVTACLLSASAVAGQPCLSGLSSVTPGALRRAPAGAEDQIWTPAAAARRACSVEEAAGALPALVEACVGALAGEAGGLLAEVSGGLDSAIVAAALSRSSPERVRQWINYHALDARGDERGYARDVAAHGRFDLTEALKPEIALTADMLAAVSTGLRPGFNGMDAARDRDVAARVAGLGVERVFTGQGGDMVFFQTPTPLVTIDHVRRTGLRGLFSPYLLEVARWTGRSVWSIARTAMRRDADWPSGKGVAGHPWLADAGDLPPAKRVQIATLAQKLIVHGECLRTRAADVVHPLLAQPLVEHCLAIPVPDLTAGGRDRALARRAFAAWLPGSVQARRSKGSLTAYYGRMVGASLAMLRPHLLEGRLVEIGILDRTRLEAALTHEHLIWRGDYAAIMAAAMMEAWVGHWEATLARRSAWLRPASR